jgi:hypothetical protein
MDTKGIPSIINSQVLKRHPMAINRIKMNLEDKNEGVTDISASSSSLPISEFSDGLQYNQSSRYYEQGLNVGHFMKENQ